MTSRAGFRFSERLRVRWAEVDSERQVLPHAQSSAASFDRRAGFEPPVVLIVLIVPITPAGVRA